MLKIGCSRSNKRIKFMSNAIVWFQAIKFSLLGEKPLPISHVFGRFVGSSWGCDFIYHQHGQGSEFIGQDRFEREHFVVEEFVLNIPREVEIAIGRSCVQREGTPYSFMQNVGIAIVGLIWILTFKKVVIKNPFTKDTNCLEEWVEILCDHLKVPKPDYVDSWLPYDFIKWLQTLPCVEVGEIRTIQS